ncbi:MAG: 4-(cytidine 5'-diphospho)-2-C-methyl-D-erythritol kinase [Myxococcota bacterium]
MTSPPQRLALDAPAKLNLGLRILGRRPDGYHTLESLFVPLDWCDRVDVEVDREAGPGVALSLAGPGRGAVPADASNLAARAAASYARAAGFGGGIRIHLAKSLPAAAGLGGGSSDAGAVLRALDRLLDRAIPMGDLAALALELGADVPYFLDPRPALVGGIGERIEPVGGLPELALVLANPGISLATADVYAAWDRSAAALTPARPGSTMRALSRLLDAPDPSPEPSELLASALGELLVNDLEAAARELGPGAGGLGVGELQERLRSQGAIATGMSGSGATVFGVFADGPAAHRALRGLAGAPERGPGANGNAEAGGSSEGTSSIDASGAWARVVRSAGSQPAARAVNRAREL